MLHLVNKSPFERNALEACLKRAVPGSSILLYEDAVYAAMRGTTLADAMAQAARRHAIYVLAPDMAARGLDPTALIAGLRPVEYDDFVDLTAAANSVQSWL